MNMYSDLQKQGGQGTIEFLIAAAFVLLPILLGVTYLGKLADTQHKNLEASRYALWEQTVWDASKKSGAQINSEINRRVYGLPEMPMDSRQDKTNTPKNLKLDSNLYIRERNRDHTMLAKFDDANVNKTELTDTKPNLGLGGIVTKVAIAGLGLSDKGLHGAEITRQAHPSKHLDDIWKNVLPKNQQELMMKARNVMLIGAWNASDAGHAESRVKRMVPTNIFSDGNLEILRQVSKPLFPDIAQFEPGLVKPELVPCQRGIGGRRGRECK